MNALCTEATNGLQNAKIAVTVWCIFDKALRGDYACTDVIHLSVDEIQKSLPSMKIKLPPIVFNSADLGLIENQLTALGTESAREVFVHSEMLRIRGL